MNDNWYNAVDLFEAEIMKAKIENKMLEEELELLKEEERFLNKKLNELINEEKFHTLESQYLTFFAGHCDENLKTSKTFQLIEIGLDQVSDILNNALQEKENDLQRITKTFDQQRSKINDFDKLSTNEENFEKYFDILQKQIQTQKNIIDINLLSKIEKWRQENTSNIKNDEETIPIVKNKETILTKSKLPKEFELSSVEKNHTLHNTTNFETLSLEIENKKDVINDSLEIVIYDSLENNSSKKIAKENEDKNLQLMTIQIEEEKKQIATPEIIFISSQTLIEPDDNQSISRNFFNCFSNLTQEEFSFYNTPNEELANSPFNFKF